jgi:hypothetical protein
MGLKSVERRQQRKKIIFFAVFEYIVINDNQHVREYFSEFMCRVISMANENCDVDSFLECKIIMGDVIENINAIIDNKMPPFFNEYVSSGKNSIKETCYFITAKSEDFDLSNSPIKVGVTNNIDYRIAQFQIGSPVELDVYGFIDSDFSAIIETYFHRKFASRRIHSEWFNLKEDSSEFEATFLALKKMFCTYKKIIQ